MLWFPPHPPNLHYFSSEKCVFSASPHRVSQVPLKIGFSWPCKKKATKKLHCFRRWWGLLSTFWWPSLACWVACCKFSRRPVKFYIASPQVYLLWQQWLSFSWWYFWQLVRCHLPVRSKRKPFWFKCGGFPTKSPDWIWSKFPALTAANSRPDLGTHTVFGYPPGGCTAQMHYSSIRYP